MAMLKTRPSCQAISFHFLSSFLTTIYVNILNYWQKHLQIA